jgi:hypothetical protein
MLKVDLLVFCAVSPFRNGFNEKVVSFNECAQALKSPVLMPPICKSA